MSPRSQNLVALLGFLALCWSVEAISAVVTAQSVGTWYPDIAKPAWTPPNWVFAPVWTALYTMMAIAAWLVWMERSRIAIKGPMVLFGLQLALNSLWSFLFFGMQQIGWAGVEIALLWVAIAACLAMFWQAKPLAGALLIPYLLWVTYATALNWAIWWIN